MESADEAALSGTPPFLKARAAEAVTPPALASRRADVDALRRLLPRLEGFETHARVAAFGLAALDAYLPQGGLALGALHEIAPEAESDVGAAFGFAAALLSRMPPTGPLMIILPAGELTRRGRPHGHGLRGFGLDPRRITLVDTADEKQTLWAAHEALRSQAPAVVFAAIAKLDLKTSQKLHFAAGQAGLPLLLLRPSRAEDASAAATIWRIGAASAMRDRFDLLTGWRWRVMLERCRNGRTGEWLVEYDHVAHCFSLASPLADPASSDGGSEPSAIRARRS